MNKSVGNYEKLVQLYRQDRATGQLAETTSETTQSKVQNSGNISCGPSSDNTIDENDLTVSQNTANLENLSEN